MDSDTDIAISLRVSTKDKRQDTENQLRQCLELAKRYSDKKPDIYRDKMSAYTKDSSERKDLNRCLGLVRSGKYKHIVFWDVDRFHRNRKRLMRDVTTYKKLGCLFHFVNQIYLDDLYKLEPPFDDMMYNFLLEWEGHRAESESMRTGLRIKAAYQAGRGRDKWGRPKVDIPESYIRTAFMRCDCNRERTSKYLGIGLVTLRKLMREYGIEGEKIKI